MALLGEQVVECQPLLHHAPCVGGVDAAPQAQASEFLGRACWRDVGLLVQWPQGFRC